MVTQQSQVYVQFIFQDLENLLDDVHDFASLRLYKVCPVIDNNITIFHIRNVHRMEFDLLVKSSNQCSTQLQAE